MTARWQPIRGYRYIVPNDVQYVDKASFKLSTLSHFRLKEGALGDNEEGIARWIIDNPDPSKELSEDDLRKIPEQVAWMYRLTRGRLSSASGVEIISHAKEKLIYCLSRKISNRYLIEQGLTTCYEIDDLISFAHAIKDDSNGLLGNIQISNVNYDIKDRFNFRRLEFYSDAFEKSVDFFAEREVRIAFDINGDVPGDGYCVIESNAAKSKMTRIR